jgi:alpha/beta superfamily hydrolase
MPPSGADAVVVESVRFPSGPYSLEGELAYGEEARAPRGAVVLAGSHPLLGGTMHNNVVRGLGDGLAGRGFITLRFNYRGVGGSEGPAVDVARHMAEFLATSHAPGEMDLWRDVQAAVASLRRSLAADLPLTLVGYSFGCSLLPLVDVGGRPGACVLIAPPLGRHDYASVAGVRRPILVVASENDFASTPGEVRAWFGRLPAPKRLVLEARDNHFFRGHEGWLVETVWDFLRDQAGFSVSSASTAVNHAG